MRMKIYVVDNGGQWTHREWRVLRDLDIDSHIIPNDTPLEKLHDADALVLSGGAPSIAYEKYKLGEQPRYLRELHIPILGICVGAQLIAEIFGGGSGPAKVPEYGKTEVWIDNSDDIFKGVPEKIIVWESHNDEIKSLGDLLLPLAHSQNCKYQAIMHKNKAIYGVQFHPEVEHTQYGEKIFMNFIEIARK